MKDHPEIRKLWWITLVIQSGQGFMNGLFLYTWGPYFYDHFSDGTASSAITFTMLLFAFRQGLVALLEIPTGALADTIGRGHTTILAFAVRSGFFLMLAAVAFCHQVTAAVFWATLASIGYAISYTLFNGAFSAWCADTLRERAPTVPYAWLSSRFIGYQSIGELLGAVLSIWLFLHHLPFVAFLLGAVVAYALVGYSINRLQEPTILQKTVDATYTASAIARQMGVRVSESLQIVKRFPVITWVVLTFGAYAFLLSLVIHLWPVYLRATQAGTNLNVAWIALAIVSLLLQLAGGRSFVWFNDRMTRRNLGTNQRFAMYRNVYAISGVTSAASVVALSIWTFRYGVAPLPLFTACVSTVIFALGWVSACFDILVNSLVPPEQAHDRATIVSAGSLARSLLTLLLAVPAGGVSAENSPIGWAIPAVLLLIATVGTYRSLRRDEIRRVLARAKVESITTKPSEVTHAAP